MVRNASSFVGGTWIATFILSSLGGVDTFSNNDQLEFFRLAMPFFLIITSHPYLGHRIAARMNLGNMVSHIPRGGFLIAGVLGYLKLFGVL